MFAYIRMSADTACPNLDLGEPNNIDCQRLCKKRSFSPWRHHIVANNLYPLRGFFNTVSILLLFREKKLEMSFTSVNTLQDREAIRVKAMVSFKIYGRHISRESNDLFLANY